MSNEDNGQPPPANADWKEFVREVQSHTLKNFRQVMDPFTHSTNESLQRINETMHGFELELQELNRLKSDVEKSGTDIEELKRFQAQAEPQLKNYEEMVVFRANANERFASKEEFTVFKTRANTVLKQIGWATGVVGSAILVYLVALLTGKTAA